MTDTQTPAAADIGDIVRAVNTGNHPFTIGWDSRQYTLEPGKDAFIPFEAACLWFGDPRSHSSIQARRNQHGLVSFIPDRDSEIRRLRVKYGNVGGDERYVDPGPSVELYDLNGGQITTVLDDPAGESVLPATPTKIEQSDLHKLIARQQEQINLLLTQMGLEPADVQGEGGDGGEEGSEVAGGEPGGEEGDTDGEAGTTEVDEDGLPVDPSVNS